MLTLKETLDVFTDYATAYKGQRFKGCYRLLWNVSEGGFIRYCLKTINWHTENSIRKGGDGNLTVGKDIIYIYVI